MDSSTTAPNDLTPTILLVDDVSKNLQNMIDILQPSGYRFVTAMNGNQAVTMAEELMPDLVLVDVMMPGIDGIEVCRRLRANPCTEHIPVILITVADETDDIVQGFRAGAKDYVLKPFIAQELTTRVKHQLAIARLAEENVRCQAKLEQMAAECQRIRSERDQLFSEMEEKNDLLEKLSVSDDMTGLYHHRYILKRLSEEIAKARRYGHDLSLILFDIDHLKQINDNYGHKTGDEVLMKLAASLMETLRETDVAGRYGGQEFMAILPHTDLAGSIRTAQRYRNNIKQIVWPYKEMNVTVSGGISSLAGQLQSQSTIKSENMMYRLIMRAHNLLYLAKEKGKDRIEADPWGP